MFPFRLSTFFGGVVIVAATAAVLFFASTFSCYRGESSVALCEGGLIPVALANELSDNIVTDHLIITELQTSGGPGLTQNDFIEIFNPTDADIDLQGYRLVKRAKTSTSDTTIKSWTASVVIPGKTYYLWANSSYADLAGSADATTTQTIADNNAVALRFGAEDTGDLIDAVAWGENISGLGEGAVFSENIPDNASLERLADTDNNQTDFTVNNTPSPRGLSAGAIVAVPPPSEEPPPATPPIVDPPLVNPPPPAGGHPPPVEVPEVELEPEVYFSEILPDPKGTDSGFEWFELFNASDFQANIGGYIVDDGDNFTPSSRAFVIPAGTAIPARGYKAFIIPRGKLAINNTGETLRLFDADKALQDIISFSGKSAEGATYAKDSSGTWRWTDIVTPDLANQFSIDQVEEGDGNEQEEPDDAYKDVKIIFNEVFGNPKGSDEGEEWVELKNIGTVEVDLAGWFLDDAGKTKSANAYKLPSGHKIAAGGLLAVKLPEGSFTITNTGDEIRLLSPDEIERAKVVVPALSDNKSFSRFADEWQINNLPTFGAENTTASQARDIVISGVELASEDISSSIRLRNNEENWLNLSFWRLELNASVYSFPNGASLAPKSELILSQEATGLAVRRSSWQNLKLVRPEGVVQAEAVNIYLAAPLASVPAVSAARTTRVEQAEIVSGVVAGDSQATGSQSTGVIAEERELPIIIESAAKNGFFHRMKGFLCGTLHFLVKCKR